MRTDSDRDRNASSHQTGRMTCHNEGGGETVVGTVHQLPRDMLVTRHSGKQTQLRACGMATSSCLAALDAHLDNDDASPCGCRTRVLGR